MPYLEQYLDTGLRIPDGITTAKITLDELARLNRLHAVATAAGEIPRRLGYDAESIELRNDKLRCRRIAHVAAQCIAGWGGKIDTKKLDVSREAATVDWPRWLQEHVVWLPKRMTFIATWQYRTGGDERWCKSAIVRLNNELSWSQYALRD